jgi:hypothetical protein
MPHRLIYLSKVANHVRYEDAESIAEVSNRNNERVGVRGLLIYTPSHFLQVLEGDPVAVRKIYDRVKGDARHHRIKILFDAMVPAAEFGKWAMAVKMPTAEIRSEAMSELSGTTALALLKKLGA